MLLIYPYYGVRPALWPVEKWPVFLTRRIVNDIFKVEYRLSLTSTSFFDDNFEVLASEEGRTGTCKLPFRTKISIWCVKTALLLDAHQSPVWQQYCAVVTQYCNSSRKEHPFENKVIHSTKIVPVLLPFPLIAVSPCLDWLVSNPLMAVE